MQVLDYPEQLPEEAAAARQQLQELLRPNDSISQVCTCIRQLWQYIYLLGSQVLMWPDQNCLLPANDSI